MAKTHKATFNAAKPVEVPAGITISDAAHTAGVEIHHPCGGQGRCGRCVVKVNQGKVKQRSSQRLTSEDTSQGYTLACQSTINSDVSIYVPPQERVERRLVTDLTARKVEIPAGYSYKDHQPTQRFNLSLTPPSMEDQTDDWSRLKRALRSEAQIENLQITLPLLRQIGTVLREGDWEVAAIVEMPKAKNELNPTLIALYPIHFPANKPLWGCAIDIGTTTVTVWLVDLITGEVKAQASEYNQQIHHGEDVISRIIFSGKEHNFCVL